MPEYRLQRVENMIREVVSEMIMKGIIKDPGISTLVSISRVDISADLSYAKMSISGFESENKINKTVDALNHASGFIQSKLGKKMHTKTTPRLSFILDTSIRDGFEMTKRLDAMNIEAEVPENDEQADS